ncbi:MAG: MBL fold metallo-hydrolase [Acidimicrobiia bacterium]|nr:MBL fold metallo-hydrolase [Acidimicrobiia bacterium]
MISVRTVLCPNPGPFTGPGTNTYVVSSGSEAVIIDPGPVHDGHQHSTIEAAAGLDVEAVLVTHTHPDHAPAANRIADHFAVPAYSFSPGPDFAPDRLLADGDRVGFGGAEIVAIHTPGHTDDHLCFQVDGLLFTGDHIMGGSTVIIENATTYLQSLRRIADREVETLYPGHGPVLEPAVIEMYIAHRQERERQIVASVSGGAETVDAIVAEVYAGVPGEVLAAARRQVEVQLRKLVEDGRLQWLRADDDVGERVQLTQGSQD